MEGAGLPLVRGERVELRPLREQDVDAIVAILAEPEVAQWWGFNPPEDVREVLSASCAVIVDGEIAGVLECHEETEPMYPSVSFDIALATTSQGSGFGPAVLRLAVNHYARAGHHRFTIDPTLSNERAVRAYEKVGFRPVGVLRLQERAPDGSGWRDGLLMDLLADELNE